MELSLLTHENIAGEAITKALKNGEYSDFKVAVAYTRNSGVSRIYNELADFTKKGGKTSIITGIDQSNTSYQALFNLKVFTKDNLFIHHDKNFDVTFHPKIYMFGNDQIERIIVGSSNLTAGGLYLNYEANIDAVLDDSKHATDFRTQVLEYWNNLLENENTKKCKQSLLEKLVETGLVVDERTQKPFKKIIERISVDIPFNKAKLRKMPSVTGLPSVNMPAIKRKFAMTLSGFDVSEKSQDPVMLVPVAALKSMPAFWGFPTFYTCSEAGYPQLYAVAEVHVDGKILKDQYIRIYYYEKKSEFRLQCEAIKRNGGQGDIIVVQKRPDRSLEFEIKLLRANSEEFKRIRPTLNYRVSPKKFFTYY